MKALSIKQPWAWLIIHGGKDIENRSWHTKHRGRFLVHASKGMTKFEYLYAKRYAAEIGVKIPAMQDLERGGIIGSVVLVDSVNSHDSPWYMGDKAFTLSRPSPLTFMPMTGRLNFFEVSDDLVKV